LIDKEFACLSCGVVGYQRAFERGPS